MFRNNWDCSRGSIAVLFNRVYCTLKVVPKFIKSLLQHQRYRGVQTFRVLSWVTLGQKMRVTDSFLCSRDFTSAWPADRSCDFFFSFFLDETRHKHFVTSIY